jgi:hypothetical protein
VLGGWHFSSLFSRIQNREFEPLPGDPPLLSIS